MRLREKIIAFISNDLLNGRVSVTAEDELLVSGLIDSLGVMRLVAYIEQECNIKIPPEDITIENFTNADAIANYIQRQLVT